MQAWHIRQEARRRGDYLGGIAELTSLLRLHPRDRVLQQAIGWLMADAGDHDAALVQLKNTIDHFPDDRRAFVALAAFLNRHAGTAAAGELIAGWLARDPNDIRTLIAAAEARDAVGDEAGADNALEQAVTLSPEKELAWSAAVRRLEARGRYVDAADYLRRSVESPGRSHAHEKRLIQVNGIVARLAAINPKVPNRLERSSYAALHGIFREIAAARIDLPPPPFEGPRSVAMLSASLAMGGSERQFVNTAVHLSARHADSRGRDVLKSVNVIVRSVDLGRNDGFFRPELDQANIDITSYRHMPLYGGDLATSALRPYAKILRRLPLTVLDSVLRLTDHLRTAQPDVLQIWQEGMVYDASLAALIAGVPRIVLCLRSVPPIYRRERYKVGHSVVFHALIEAPGVRVCANSQTAADRYADWLGIDGGHIAVIPNGVAKLSAECDATGDALFREFDGRIGHGALTIGAVMRMDQNKRPLLWIEAAAKILRDLPAARFILVGDGKLRPRAMKLARELGIAERCLFVGASHFVGYWLSKMDVLMLLSKQEGLPNALIEAQLAGVPVVATPAGGAAEAIIDGVTGIMTKPDPMPDEIAAIISALERNPLRRRRMGDAAIEWATKTFSMTTMIDKTIDVIGGADDRVDQSLWYKPAA